MFSWRAVLLLSFAAAAAIGVLAGWVDAKGKWDTEDQRAYVAQLRQISRDGLLTDSLQAEHIARIVVRRLREVNCDSD